ncbi:MAG TPA: glutathione S-transferase N-terminal domain-containing protein [Candidatus Paceibacterota bacterium]
MFILYYKPTCSFSERVIQMAKNLNVSLDLRDISESEEALAELLEKGGAEKTPFFVDTETGVSMYESSDIIDYMREHGKQVSPIAVNKPRVHVGGSVCESCEG